MNNTFGNLLQTRKATNFNFVPISKINLTELLILKLNQICIDKNISLNSIFVSAFQTLLHNYQFEPEIFDINLELLTYEKDDIIKIEYKSLAKSNIPFLEICKFNDEIIKSNFSNNNQNEIVYLSLIPNNVEILFDLSLKINILSKIEIEFYNNLKSNYYLTTHSSAYHFEYILEQIVDNINVEISNINILQNDEKKKLDTFCSGIFNESISNSKNLIELFENTVQTYPNNPAIIDKNKSISYKELNEKANNLATIILNKNIGKGNFIGILIKRSIDTFITMLAILKSGNAYIPLDPSYPLDRITYILNDCKAKILITNSLFNINEIKQQNINCEIFDFENLDLNNSDCPNPNINIIGIDLAYAIYTSGTTGMPKGVKINNASICNLVKAESLIYNINSNDRVVQGFSIAFDASLEEIWMAFYAGAVLVIADEETMKSGQEISKFLNVNKVNIFSTVPTLLSVLEDEIPSLKLLILGGEVCSRELIDPWLINGRRIINTYGPTEATVVTTFFECQKDMDVNIGKPLQNYSVYLLNSELKQVPFGIPGEIYIGGLSLSDGYINKDDLNKTKFISPNFDINNNFPNRLYASGDLGRLNQDGDIEYFGRIDSQVKIRGYRVELNEIESQLSLNPEIKSAAVAIKKGFNEMQILVAYIIKAKNIVFNEHQIKELLKSKLPSYMIPSIYILLDEFPLLPSGKIDRKKLPDPIINNEEILDFENSLNSETEIKLLKVWSKLFSLNNIKIEDNFFDLGGHSLLASQMISELRKDVAMSQLSVQDIYTHLTIKQLSIYIDSKQNKSDTKKHNFTQNNISISNFEKYTVILLQMISILFFYGLISSFVILPILIGNYYKLDDFPFYLMTIGVLFSAFPFLIIISIALKWIIIGKYKVGSYPIGGYYYFRFWLSKKIIDFVPLSLIVGSPFFPMYYKLMGTKVGKNVFLDSDRVRIFDLVSIGDNTSISKEAHLMGYTVEYGMLHLGKITIGNNCYIGPRSLMSLNSEMKPYSSLLELSMLPLNEVIESGEEWKGSPAKFHNLREDFNNANSENNINSNEIPIKSLSNFVTNFIFIFAVSFVISIPLMIALPIAETLFTLEEKLWIGYVLILSIPAAAIYILLFCLIVAALKWILIGKQKPMDISINSTLFIRKWIVDNLLHLNLLLLKSIYATIFLPYWLRLMGAKIGRRAEISTVNQISVDMLEIGEESFIADSVNVGSPLVFNGVMKLRITSVGKRTFIGNSAVIPTGSSVADNSLIGVLSTPPVNEKGDNLDGTSWLGSPPMFLPKRQESMKFSEEFTFNPPLNLIIKRGIIEFFKITFPYALEISLFGIFYYLVFEFYNINDTFSVLFGSMFIFAGLCLLSPFVAFFIKKTIVNKYIKDVKPLWSLFVWKNEFINSISENFVYPMFQNLMIGTPFAPFFFRFMGCKIGKNTYMETTEITEYDLVHIGDNATLNFGCTIQTHLFEDRVMKMSDVFIGNNCNVGALSVVLYDTVMEDNSGIEGLSLLMKGESLPKGTIWQGAPVKYSHNK